MKYWIGPLAMVVVVNSDSEGCEGGGGGGGKEEDGGGKAGGIRFLKGACLWTGWESSVFVVGPLQAQCRRIGR